MVRVGSKEKFNLKYLIATNIMKVSNCCHAEILTGIGRLVCSKCNEVVNYKNCIEMETETKIAIVPYVF